MVLPKLPNPTPMAGQLYRGDLWGALAEGLAGPLAARDRVDRG
jgi:hypothetical protein